LKNIIFIFFYMLSYLCVFFFVDSALIDFGEVCQRSVKTEYLTVGNNLDQHIHIVVNVSIVCTLSNCSLIL
jgi:hypothetical protein